MKPKEFAEAFLRYLETIKSRDEIDGWICDGKNKIKNGSRFYFNKGDKKLSILSRPVTKKGPYISIYDEKIKDNGIYHMPLSDDTVYSFDQASSSLKLLEYYTMGRRGLEGVTDTDIKNAFIKKGKKSPLIVEVEVGNINWGLVLQSLLDWAVLRKEIKLAFKFNDSIETVSINEASMNKKVSTTVVTQPLNQILFGPPGTGKTYTTINKAIAIVDGISEEQVKTVYEDRKALKERFDELLINDEESTGQIAFCTFHQSMSYEDFIEGIKPQKPVLGDAFVKYDIQSGIFKKINERAKSNYENAKNENKGKLEFEEAFEKLKEEWDNNQGMKFPLRTEGYDFTIIGFTNTSIQFKKASGGTSHTLSINTLKELYYGREIDFKQGVGIYYPSVLAKINSYSRDFKHEVKVKPYVLIIDEINRGNVSQIFGELITLIEEDKRLGNDEALEVTLPYSKEKFSVPPNLYIIGTMNTADRSVEALDTALRRRFSFEEMPPDAGLIRTHGKLKESNGNLNGWNLAGLLNTLNKRIERLLDKDHLIGHSYFLRVGSEADLKGAFQHNIIPLLQEYFFGDYGKMGLVIGKGFFEEAEKEPLQTDKIFADMGSDYNPADFATRRIFRLKDISRMTDDEFGHAITLLLNK